jgi:hypothetical protein
MVRKLLSARVIAYRLNAMLLVVSGRWHAPKEPLVPPGWEDVFRLVAGEAHGRLHCSVVLAYKSIQFEDFATREMVEAAMRFNLEKCVELAAAKLMDAPEDIVELDVLPQQVAAACALSQHKIVKALVQGEQVTVSRRLQLTPLEILRELYSRPQNGTVELRLTVGPSDWKTVKAAASLQDLTPEDGLAVLMGDEERKAEIVSLLKVRLAEMKRVRRAF